MSPTLKAVRDISYEQGVLFAARLAHQIASSSQYGWEAAERIRREFELKEGA